MLLGRSRCLAVVCSTTRIVCLSILTLQTLAAGLLVASVAHAASYGSFTASDVTYVGLRDEVSLYGAPSISGNTMIFTSLGFEAACPGVPPCEEGGVFEQLTDRLYFNVAANPGSFLRSITVVTTGETTLSSTNSATVRSTAFSHVTVEAGQVNVGNAFTDRTFETSEVGPSTYQWRIEFTLDVFRLFGSRISSVGIRLLSSVNASVPDGGQAQNGIQRIDFATVTIPEPTTALLLGLGLVGMAIGRRKRHA